MEDANRKDKMVARMLELIDQMSSDESGLEGHKVEFFFYTRHIEWAHVLANNLRSLQYKVQVTRSASSITTYLINGWTPPMDLEEDNLEGWSEQMTQLAARCHCQFDGWGTIIE